MEAYLRFGLGQREQCVCTVTRATGSLYNTLWFWTSGFEHDDFAYIRLGFVWKDDVVGQGLQVVFVNTLVSILTKDLRQATSNKRQWRNLGPCRDILILIFQIR